MNWIVKKLAGEWDSLVPEVGEFQRKLSPGALALLHEAFSDLDGQQLWDYHTHLGGIGKGGTGCCVNHTAFQPLLHPIKHVKKSVFLSACGVLDEEKTDQEFLERLVGLIRSARAEGFPWGKHFLLGLDCWHDPDGSRSLEKTGLYVPNDYLWETCEKYPDCFEPCISVHPYSPTAIEQLDKWGEKGVRMCKWLPNAQGIDPSTNCEKFYDTLLKWDITLLTHTGEEHAVSMGELKQRFGNPLLLRIPLQKGVRVIAAHCASEGNNHDLDDPSLPLVHNFHLLKRLMKEFPENLFCDISSMTAFRRLGEPLNTIIDDEEWHPRLVNGSDYPVPAINIVVQTQALVRHGYITEEERGYLNEIYAVNPLVFDYVTKRVLKSPNTQKKLPKEIFFYHPKIVKSTPPSISTTASQSSQSSSSPTVSESSTKEATQETTPN